MDSKSDKAPDSKTSPSGTKEPFKGGFGVGLLSTAAILLAIGVAIIPLVAAKPGDGLELSPWMEVMGNLHFVTLHVPIGIFTLIFLMEVLGVLSFGKYKPATSLPLFFGVVTGVIAVIQGYLLYLQSGKSNPDIEWHMWGAIAFVSLSAVTYMTKIWAIRSGVRSPVYALLLTSTVVAMILAGHWGGESVHGEGSLFGPLQQAEDGDGKGKGKVVPVVAPEERLAYKEVVASILEAKCYQCHSEGKKKKGKLLMDSYEALLAGGKEGPALVPGDLEESLMISRILIPIDDDFDDEHMPPADEEQLTADEIAVLEWWVKSGAPQGKSMKEAGASEAILASVSTLVPPEVLRAAEKEKETAAAAAKAVEDAKKAELQKAVSALSAEFNNALNFVSQDSGDLVFSAVGIRKDFGDEGLQKLTQVGGALIEMNLSGSNVTDAGLAHLKEMPGLRKLRLNDTAVTDAGLDHLAGLPSLEFLVLFGTEVSDEGIVKLGEASALKKLYVGSTKVTEAGVKELLKKLPELEVNTGA